MVLFPLDHAQYGRPAQMIANLVALDTTAVFARAVRLGLSGDGLAWFGPGELVAGPVLRDMISTGRQAGLASVLSTWSTSAAAADELAGLADVLVLAGPQDPARAAALPPGLELPPGAPDRDQLAVVLSGPPRQVLPSCRFVPGYRGVARPAPAGPAVTGPGTLMAGSAPGTRS